MNRVSLLPLNGFRLALVMSLVNNASIKTLRLRALLVIFEIESLDI